MIDDGGCIPSRQLIQAFSYVSAVSPPSASRYIPTLLITCLINRITASLWDMLRKFCDEEKSRGKSGQIYRSCSGSRSETPIYV